MLKSDSLIRIFLRFYKPEIRDLWIIFTYAFVTGALFLVVPIAANSLVTTIAFGQLLQPLAVLSLFVLFGLLFAALLKVAQVKLVELMQQRLFVRQATTLTSTLTRIDYQFTRDIYAPGIVNRFLEVVVIQKVTSQMMMEGLGVVFQVFTGLVLISFYHPYLLIFGLALLFMIAIILLVGAGATKSAVIESTKKYELLDWLEDIARFPLLFKSAWGGRLARRKADQLILNYIGSRRQHFKVLVRQYIGAYSVQAIGSSLLLILGGWLVMINELTLGQLVSAEIVVSASVASVSKLGKTFESIYDLFAAVVKVEAVKDLPLEKHDGTICLDADRPFEVSFSEIVLRNRSQDFKPINLTVATGSKIAIFGRNASGKSTLANYLLGLELPVAGQVKLQGVDIRDLDLLSLRSQVHLVRGIEVLAGSIEINVNCLRPQIASEDVLKALEQVGLLEIIQKLPEGIRTNLSPGGAPLSTGQLAQLMLARAIVGKPRLIVLDETLDTIDPLSLKYIYQVLLDPKAPWTLIDLTSDPVVWSGFESHYRLSATGLQALAAGVSVEKLSDIES